MRTAGVAFLVVLGGAGCPILPADGDDAGEAGDAGVAADAAETGDAAADALELTVLTYNLYLGTDFGAMFQVGSLDAVPAAAANAWAEVQATRFDERAEAVADAIAAKAPALIGLQEVELYRTQSPGDGWQGEDAEDVALDFLQLLLDALQDRGLDYAVAAEVETADFEVPMQTEAGSDDIRLTDRDVILAAPGVEVSSPQAHTFEAAASVPIPGTPFAYPLPKGWVAVDATWRGHTFRFASTHLEVTDAEVQRAQGEELIEALAGVELPLLLVGDLNSDPDAELTPTQQDLIAAGYQDAWSVSGERGPTCCQAGNLRNPESNLRLRIDHVLHDAGFEAVAVDRVGHLPESRTPSGLWPSDHAGVVATLRMVPGV